MASDELEVVRLRIDFYRDGFNKVFITLLMTLLGIVLLCAVMVGLYLQRPAPVVFATDKDWRIVAPVPVNQPYLSDADLLQWVSDVLPDSFTYDFINYKDQNQALRQYYTNQGWDKFVAILNTSASYNAVTSGKYFVNGSALGAPTIENEGMLPEGNYGWWIKMPVNVHFESLDKANDSALTLRVLVVRVSTLNNLSGVAINDVVVVKEEKGEGGPVQQNG